MVAPTVRRPLEPPAALHALLLLRVGGGGGGGALVRDHRDVGRQGRGRGHLRVPALDQGRVAGRGLDGEPPLEGLGGERGVGDAADGGERGAGAGDGDGGLVPLLAAHLHRQRVGGQQLVRGQAPAQLRLC